VGGWAVSKPYYSQHMCSVCVSLSTFFIKLLKVVLCLCLFFSSCPCRTEHSR